MYVPLFSKLLRKTGNEGILVPLNTCLPTVILNVNKKCFKLAKKNLDTILADKKIQHVFIAMTWYNENYYDLNSDKKKPEALKDAVVNLINQINSKGKSVSLISPIAIPNEDLASELPRKIKFKRITNKEIEKKISIDRKKYNAEFNKINLFFEEFLDDNYIKVFEDLCDLKKCFFAKGDIMYFSDSSHLAQHSLTKLTKSEKQIMKILKNVM